MIDIAALLESERRIEREFVGGDRPVVNGWTVSLTMFHLARWRERLVASLEAFRDGRAGTPPPEKIDEFNDAEMSGAALETLEESHARADALLDSLSGLYAGVGERPFTWYNRKTTGEAVLGNSYTHPRFHMVQFMRENGDSEAARKLMEDSIKELRIARAPANFVQGQQYNLACLLVGMDAKREAMALLEECLPEHAQLRELAPIDPDLAPLKGDPRFEALFS